MLRMKDRLSFSVIFFLKNNLTKLTSLLPNNSSPHIQAGAQFLDTCSTFSSVFGLFLGVFCSILSSHHHYTGFDAQNHIFHDHFKRLTQIDEAHHHICIIQKGSFLIRGQMRALSCARRLISVQQAFHMAFLVRGYGVVQVQHEKWSGVELSVRYVRSGSVRQAQDGENFLLHLPLLVRPQPPVDETLVHFVVPIQ